MEVDITDEEKEDLIELINCELYHYKNMTRECASRLNGLHIKLNGCDSPMWEKYKSKYLSG